MGSQKHTILLLCPAITFGKVTHGNGNAAICTQKAKLLERLGVHACKHRRTTLQCLDACLDASALAYLQILLKQSAWIAKNANCMVLPKFRLRIPCVREWVYIVTNSVKRPRFVTRKGKETLQRTSTRAVGVNVCNQVRERTDFAHPRPTTHSCPQYAQIMTGKHR